VRSFEEFVFSYDRGNLKFSLLQVVVFYVGHLYPS
jgi:hypothetical protein